MFSELEKEIIIKIFTDEEREKESDMALEKFDVLMKYNDELVPIIEECRELKKTLKLYRQALGRLMADKAELESELAGASAEIRKLQMLLKQIRADASAGDMWKISDYSRIREQNKKMAKEIKALKAGK